VAIHPRGDNVIPTSESCILVTGGAGFIGSNFVLHWIGSGKGKVVNLDLLTYAGNPGNLRTLENDPRHVLVRGDICDRKLVDAAGKPVTVEHRYRTSVGMSFDTILRQGLRQNKNLEPEVQRYKGKYCVDDNFLKSVDGLRAADKPGKPRVVERRISYVLTTGANWAGPIKDFRLVVDKGNAERVVSFCGQDIKEISATQLELRAADFTPKQDLEILILGPN